MKVEAKSFAKFHFSYKIIFLIRFNVKVLKNLTTAHKLSKNLRSQISILTIKQEFKRAKIIRLK